MESISAVRAYGFGFPISKTTQSNLLVEVAEKREASGSKADDTDDTALVEAPAEDGKVADPEDSSAHDISRATTGADESENTLPRRDEGIPDEFAKLSEEAERLQRQIVDIEAEIAEGAKAAEARLASHEIKQILLCCQIWMHVDEGKIGIEVVNEYADKAGVKEHGNQKIPCSRLMRAIVASRLKKGDRNARRRRQRATTYAGAVDYARRNKWTLAEFEKELVGSREVGNHHGIEHLAAKGRATRRKEGSGQGVPSPSAMAYRVTGDFVGITPGDYLMLITVAQEAAEMTGALLKASKTQVRRAVTADENARLKAT